MDSATPPPAGRGAAPNRRWWLAGGAVAAAAAACGAQPAAGPSGDRAKPVVTLEMMGLQIKPHQDGYGAIITLWEATHPRHPWQRVTYLDVPPGPGGDFEKRTTPAVSGTPPPLVSYLGNRNVSAAAKKFLLSSSRSSSASRTQPSRCKTMWRSSRGLRGSWLWPCRTRGWPAAPASGSWIPRRTAVPQVPSQARLPGPGALLRGRVRLECGRVRGVEVPRPHGRVPSARGAAGVPASVDGADEPRSEREGGGTGGARVSGTAFAEQRMVLQLQKFDETWRSFGRNAGVPEWSYEAVRQAGFKLRTGEISAKQAAQETDEYCQQKLAEFDELMAEQRVIPPY